eukprot:5569857-Alexandrium_andersonii.AAC.1
MARLRLCATLALSRPGLRCSWTGVRLLCISLRPCPGVAPARHSLKVPHRGWSGCANRRKRGGPAPEPR